jgi:hypothetical protein
MKESFPLVTLTLLGILCISLNASNHRAPSDLTLPSNVATVDVGNSVWTENPDGSITIEKGVPGFLAHGTWFEGARPSREEMVVLELEYLDNFDLPAVVEILAGMDTERGGWFELHRFGGAKTGDWKKIRIPAPSDLIWQHVADKTIRFRLMSRSGELSIRNPVLASPRSDEEEVWNAATREWVRREQHQRVRIDPIYWAQRQTPVLAGAMSASPLVVYERDYLHLIEPRSAPQADETSFPVEVHMFLNEYQPIQFGVYASQMDLKNVQVTVNSTKRLPLDFTLRAAEYSIVKNQQAGYFLNYFPQRLWPAYPFDVAKGRSHLVLLDIKTIDGETVTGSYRINVQFAADGIETVSVPIVIEVLPIRLLTMKESGLKMGGCVTGLLPEYEMEALHQYNHNMINLWYAGVRPQFIRKGSGFELGFEIMDDFMLRAKRQGFDDIVYFLGGNPPLFPRTMTWPRTIAEELHGIAGEEWRRLSFEDPYRIPSILVDEMVEWARRFGEHSVASDWPNMILTPFDEPAKWVEGSGNLLFIKDQFIEQIKLLRRGWPGVEIYGSIHYYYGGVDFLGSVDVFCTNINVHPPRLSRFGDRHRKIGEEVREADTEFWEYAGCDDKGLPARARYVFGHYFGSHDSRGSLAWAYNWGNRFDTIDGNNWMYAWNTPFDLVPAPYLIGMREAWDDRRLRETVRSLAQIKGVDLMAFWGRLHKEIAHEYSLGESNTIDSFWENAKDNQAMEAWKSEMTEKVLWLQSLPAKSSE